VSTESDRLNEQRERIADALISDGSAHAASLPRSRIVSTGRTLHGPLVADLVYVTPDGARYEIQLRELEAPGEAS
jgi:hypothetical protein